MSLKFRCQACGEEIIVRDLETGETTRCVHCGANNQVPGNATPMDEELNPIKEETPMGSREESTSDLSKYGYEMIIKVCPKCLHIWETHDLWRKATDKLFGVKDIEQCLHCKIPLVPKRVFVRWNLERIYYLVLLAWISLIVGGLSQGKGTNMESNPEYTVWQLFFWIPIFIISAYIVAGFFLKIGRLRQYFLGIEPHALTDDDLRFSWKRFATEPLYMFVPIGAVILLWLAVEFYRWLKAGLRGPFPP